MKPLTKNRAELLKLFHTNPDRSFYMQEIGRILGKKPGTFQRTLNNMVSEGILTSEYMANCIFRRIVATDSEPKWPPIPIHCGQSFRSNLATLERMTRRRWIIDLRAITFPKKRSGGGDGSQEIIHAQDQRGTASPL